MVKCVFCGREEHSFKGVHLIQNDGNVSFFCSSKCRKNTLKLKRDKRKLKWTLAYKDARVKTVAKDKDKAEKAEKVKVEKEKADKENAEKAKEEKN